MLLYEMQVQSLVMQNDQIKMKLIIQHYPFKMDMNKLLINKLIVITIF